MRVNYKCLIFVYVKQHWYWFLCCTATWNWVFKLMSQLQHCTTCTLQYLIFSYWNLWFKTMGFSSLTHHHLHYLTANSHANELSLIVETMHSLERSIIVGDEFACRPKRREFWEPTKASSGTFTTIFMGLNFDVGFPRWPLVLLSSWHCRIVVCDVVRLT